MDLGSCSLFVFSWHEKKNDDTRWCVRQKDAPLHIFMSTSSDGVSDYMKSEALPWYSLCLASNRSRLLFDGGFSMFWNTSLTKYKLGFRIFPCWEHGAIINVDHSIEDAGQEMGERESVKRAGIVRPGWEWARGMWAEREPCEAWERDTIVPHGYPLSQITAMEAWGHGSCCSA